jgi:hypothetical protein
VANKGAYDPYLREERTRAGGMLYIIMIVIAVAFGGLLWQLYSAGPDIPHIAAPVSPYKVAPGPNSAASLDEAEEAAISTNVDNAAAQPAIPAAVPAAASHNAAIVGPAPASAPISLAGEPVFAADGRFVAQVAALQSQDAAQSAWQRLASRAPQLFARAALDVERADLGQRGVYYRVRAGYFADHANAAIFCDRVRQMGQDCIAVAR